MAFKDTGVIIGGTHLQDLGALAAQAAVKVDGNSVGEDFRMLKNEIWAQIDGATGDQLNSLYFGLCDGALTAAQIAEAITSETTDRNDIPAKEQNMRPVWILGSVTSRQDQTIINAEFIGANGSPEMIWKKRWTFSNPEGWDYFVFNNSGVTLTTGALCRVVQKAYGLWVT